jgi:hypothetical protein
MNRQRALVVVYRLAFLVKRKLFDFGASAMRLLEENVKLPDRKTRHCLPVCEVTMGDSQ